MSEPKTTPIPPTDYQEVEAAIFTDELCRFRRKKERFPIRELVRALMD